MHQEPLRQQMMDDAVLHRIRKLKWIGMEREAEALERELRKERPHDSILSEPAETD